MSHGLGRGGVEAALSLGPVDDLPNVLEVVGLDVLVVEVEAGMLAYFENIMAEREAGRGGLTRAPRCQCR